MILKKKGTVQPFQKMVLTAKTLRAQSLNIFFVFR